MWIPAPARAARCLAGCLGPRRAGKKVPGSVGKEVTKCKCRERKGWLRSARLFDIRMPRWWRLTAGAHKIDGQPGPLGLTRERNAEGGIRAGQPTASRMPSDHLRLSALLPPLPLFFVGNPAQGPAKGLHFRKGVQKDNREHTNRW